MKLNEINAIFFFRHTDPGPFDSLFQQSGWNKVKEKEIGRTKDYIVVYQKTQYTCEK